MSSKNKLLPLFLAAAVSIAAAFAVVIFYAPLELNMGMVQKVFYFHMSSAWVGMLAFIVAAVFGVLYLRKRDLRWDRLAASSVEVGLVFTVITIISGMLWARPIWNTWWTWDPRLTTVTIMAFTYIAYILLRRGMEEPFKRAQFSAVYALVGVVSVPLTFFSARLLRTIHPIVFGANNAEMSLDPYMLQTMFISLAAFTVLYAALLLQRARLMEAEDSLHQLQTEVEFEQDWEDNNA